MNEYELRLILKSADELIKNDSKEIRVLREEVDKLNNIINELEHYLKVEKWKSVGGIHLGFINGVLNKLQELKVSDKENKNEEKEN